MGRGQRRGAGVPQSRLVVGARAEHAWPLSYPPPWRTLPLAGWAEVPIHRVEGSRGSRERGAAPAVTSLCPELQGGVLLGVGGMPGQEEEGEGWHTETRYLSGSTESLQEEELKTATEQEQK